MFKGSIPALITPFRENKIDLLIASHALVLTDYLEFIDGINKTPHNIKNIIIVSQNPLNRPATLFYAFSTKLLQNSLNSL